MRLFYTDMNTGVPLTQHVWKPLHWLIKSLNKDYYYSFLTQFPHQWCLNITVTFLFISCCVLIKWFVPAGAESHLEAETSLRTDMGQSQVRKLSLDQNTKSSSATSLSSLSVSFHRLLLLCLLLRLLFLLLCFFSCSSYLNQITSEFSNVLQLFPDSLLQSQTCFLFVLIKVWWDTRAWGLDWDLARWLSALGCVCWWWRHCSCHIASRRWVLCLYCCSLILTCQSLE